MPYQTITTLSTGNTLTAAHLNILADNAQFLHDAMHHSNWPCPSRHLTETSGFSDLDHIYTFRHRLPTLRYRIANETGTLNYYRVFYGGRLVINDEDPIVSPYTGSVNLHNLTTWPNYVGAWALSVSYHDNATGNKDGDIVTHGEAYYVCKLGHTSAAANEPGVGASWETYWTLIVAPVVGSLYECFVSASFTTGPRELAIEYLYEDA